jgi:2-keto-4-pentenoate hydratase/2-oxohepta-3-ene-1,7-dioic acid hydratase in catechol pathway
MRLVSYHTDRGPAFGAVVEDGVVDLRALGFGETLRGLLETGRLAEVAAALPGLRADAPLASVVLEAPIPNPHMILAVGANYADHAAEMNRELLGDPIFFSRFPASVVAHGQSILKPKVSDHLDYEGELAVIIGRTGRHVSEAEADDYIAGYTIFNDGTIRDYQQVSIVVGKNFEASGAMGPWMVTPDELVFPLSLETRVNGERRQHATTDTMIFAIPRLIAYASSFITLRPGDVIATGTPAGVGMRRKPPCWLAQGDRVEIEIAGIGTLANSVHNEAG